MTPSIASGGRLLPHLVALHARAQPERPALQYLVNGEDVIAQVTYRAVASRAYAIARELMRRDLIQRPVLLLYPPGPEYLAALLGCFCAGAIAVPAYPPNGQRLARTSERVRNVVDNAGARIALTTAAVATSLVGTLGELELVATDAWETTADELNLDHIDADQACLLQYTSGSTTLPKGVLVTHAQLSANLEMIATASDLRGEGPMTTWLPPYHDMGLIGTLLFPLSVGRPIVQLSPEAFIRKPIRWLRALSTHRAVATVTPNFAFELCLRRTSPAERDGLDLSALQTLFTGSEPIDARSVRAFSETFAPYGLRGDAITPCYGMAEATLVLSSSLNRAARPTLRHYDAAKLRAGRAVVATDGDRLRTLVACGTGPLRTNLRIVDPRHCVEVERGEIGEIWAMSPSVASGYWGHPDLTRNTFHARLADTDEGPFLRTGDLGFVDDGELFITGRLKDTIIIRGKNHFPQDIERSVQRLDPALIVDAGVAFSIEIAGQERLCIVQELDHRLGPDTARLLATIPQRIHEQHEIAVHALVFVKRGAVLKTSSGKVRRAAMKALFERGSLVAVARWDSSTSARVAECDTVTDQSTEAAGDSELRAVRQTHTRLVTAERRAQNIEHFLRQWVAQRAGLALEAIDIDAALVEYGVDSVSAAELAQDLEAWLQTPIPTTVSYDYPCIRVLSRALAGLAPSVAREREAPVAAPDAATDPIAIVGMACRFPGAESLDEFWRLLQTARDVITEIPATRSSARPAVDSSLTPSAAGRFGGFIADIEHFDAAFFGIAPREARSMDPQQRLFLEVAWHALEDAGIGPDSLAGTDTGVFAAVCGSDHALLHAADLNRVDVDFGTGHASSIVPNRVSYFLDLTGPSLAFDSACSSALVALQAACQSLRCGEASLAIVGGVNAVLAPHPGLFFAHARALASDGRCKTFDKSADGFVRSEGCGAVVLQRLSQARAQGNRVYALVTGTAMAHAGVSNGLMAPNGRSQERVIRRALDQARLTPDALDYVEAHGVGTPLADAVELRALGAVLQTGTRAAACWVGSVKTNLGHLEAASGIASLMKAALALHHEEIPAHLHLRELHSDIADQALPIAIPTQTVAWRRSERPRHAGVSAFGLGGTNAHAILGEAPSSKPHMRNASRERSAHVLAVSARSSAALAVLCARLADAITTQPTADACFTANTGRKHWKHRAAFVADCSDALREALLSYTGTGPLPAQQPRVGVSFWADPSAADGCMDLYAEQPLFRSAYERAANWLAPECDVHLDASAGAPTHDERWRAYARGLVCQYALYELLKQWGVEFAALDGHGSGEYLAAAAAGAVGWPEALRLALHRAQVLASLVPGALIARTVQQFRIELRQLALQPAHTPLRLASHAQHVARGAFVDLDSWHNELYASEVGAPTGTAGSEGLVVALGGRKLIEVCTAASRVLTTAAPPSAATQLLETIAELYRRGVTIDWQAFDRPFAREKVSLPPYPYERVYCWLEPSQAARAVPIAPTITLTSPHPLLRRMTVSPAQPAETAPIVCVADAEPRENTG